jgi:uncharacterized protein YuzE
MAAQHLADLAPLTRRPLSLLRNRVYRLWRGGALLDRFQGQPDPADRNVPEEWVGSTTVSRIPGRPPDEGLSRVSLPDGSSVVLKVTYDQETDSLTITLREDRIKEGDEVRPGVIADFGYDGGIVCFEIMQASKVVKNAREIQFAISE